MDIDFVPTPNEVNDLWGAGFEIGLVTSTHIARHWSFQLGVSFAHRTPIVNELVYNGGETYDYILKENAISIPALIRVGGKRVKFAYFFETGIQLDYALTDIADRDAFDVGVVIGNGFRFGRYVELDFRVIMGMLDFVDVSEQDDNMLMQFSGGLTIMFKGKR